MNIKTGLRALALGVAMTFGATCVQSAVYSSGTYQLQRNDGVGFQDVGLSVSLTFAFPTIPDGTLWQYGAQGSVTWTSGIEDHVWWAAYPTFLYEGAENTSMLMTWNSNGFAASPCRYAYICHASWISPTIDSTKPILILGQADGFLQWLDGVSSFSVAYNVALPDGYSLVAAPIPGPITPPSLPGCGPSGNRPPKCNDATVAVPGPIAGAGLPALLTLGGFVWTRRRKAAASMAV